MQLTIYLNQERMIEWKLNLTQASLVAILAQAPTWAEHKTIDGKLYFWVSKNIIISELPAVFKAKDTVYRTLKNLEEKGLIEYAKQGDKDMVCLTEEIKKWNIKDQPSTSEKNPRFGKKSELTRKKIRIASEKNPNHLGKKSDITDNNRSEAYISDANRTERESAHETKKPKKRAHQLPEDWQPSKELIAWAKAENISIDVIAHSERFKDYWIGGGQRKADWDATWRNWMRREQDYQADRKPKKPSPHDLSGQKWGKNPTLDELPF